MVPVATLSTLALNALASVLLGWTTWTASQSREQPSAIPFIALLATLTLWAVFSFGSELPGVSAVNLLSTTFNLAQFGTALALPGIWTVYTLSYTGRGTGLTWRRIALLAGIALPVAISAAVIALGSSETAVERAIAPLIGTELLYLFALFLYATYLLVDLGGSHPRVSNTQVLVLTGGVAAPYLVSLVGNSTSLVGNTTTGLLLSGGLLAVAVRRYPVMTGFPKADYVARTRVVETLQEALVVLDWDDHVLDVNEATATLFDRSAETMIGEPIRSVIDGLGETELSTGATGTVALRTSKGRRQFQFSVSAVDEAEPEDADNPVARTVLFRDVTDRQTREQRLTVLNRILRHNVRNDLDVVLAYADHVDDEELRTGIRAHTADLLELSTKVRDAEAVMTESTESPEPVDLTGVANAVADQFRADDESADVSLDCPDELLISTHRRVIRRVLSELVENSLVHTTKDSPRVEIGVREVADGAVELSVADDGPGLPEREREILAAGSETQLKHGQGIGLWFVNWAVTQLGGDLRFEENEPEGSIVTIRLYGRATP
jgi:signal transduction histidine kinase